MTRIASLALAALAVLLAVPAQAQVAVCSHEWNNASGGDWNTAANWTPAAVPSSGDDACITLDGTYTVSATSGADIDVNSLALGGSSGTQTLDLARDIVLASGGTVAANGVVEWSVGYLTGGATLTMEGTLVLDGINFNGRGVSGVGTVLRTDGSTDWQSEEFTLDTFGVWENTGTVTYTGTGSTEMRSGTGDGVFENSGTVHATGSGGTLNLRTDARHDGAVLTADAGATLALAARVHTFAGTTTGSPDGLVRVRTSGGMTAEAGATIALGGEGLSWETGFLTSGTLTNDGLVVMDGINFNGRGVTGAGTVFANAATVRWDREEFILSEGGEFENTGTIDAPLEANGSLNSGANGGLFDNRGTVSVSGSETFTVDVTSRQEDAVLTATADAVLRFDGPSTHTFAGTTTGDPAGLVRLNAPLAAEAGATVALGGEGLSWETGFLTSGTLTNDGLVVLDGINFNGRGVTGAGTVFANAATVRWDREEFILSEGGEFENTGTIDAPLEANGSLNSGANGGLFDNRGTVSVSGSETFTVDVTSRQEDAVLTATADAVLRFDGPSTHTFAGTTTGDPAGLVRLNAPLAAEAGATVALGGEGLSWETGFLTSGTLTNDGLVVLDGINFNGRGVSDGATFANADTVRWEQEEFTLSDAATWQNDGVLVGAFGTGSGLLRSGAGGGVILNTGLVTVESGTLDVNVQMDHQVGAVIGGSGTFDIAGSAFTHDGDTAPGTSPGILTWTGKPWAPPATATLTVEIAGPALGTEYDQLDVNGAATLDGILEIDVTSTSGLTVGDTFTILTASGGVTGTFSSISVTGLPGPTFSVAYNTNDVVLTLDALASPLTLRGQPGWRTLSTPFPDLPLGGREYGMLETIYTSGYLRAQRDQRNTRGTANVFLYDESTGEYAPPFDDGPIPGGTGFWVYVFNDDDSFTPGTQGGFPKPLQSSGTPATFPFDIPVTYTPSVVRDPMTTPALGFNLVGNPANSDLDWDDPNWTKDNVSDVLYIYDPKFNDGDGGWRTWNGTTGTLPSGGLIPIGQGFHVETTDANPQLVVPTSAVLGTQSSFYRLTSGEETAPTRASKAEAAPLLRFHLNATVGTEQRTGEAFVSFERDATLGFDSRDARLLAAAPGGTHARLYTTIGDAHGEDAGTALQITALPAPEDGVLQIGLGADVVRDGAASDADATLLWEATALPEAWSATLVDRHSGARYDLTAAGSAPLAISAAEALTVTEADAGTSRVTDQTLIDAAVALGDLLPTPKSPQARALRAVAPAASLTGTASAATRFVIEIDPLGALAGETEPGLSAVYPNPAARVARVELRLLSETDVRIGVYDVLGRRVADVYEGVFSAGIHTVEVPVSALAPGAYIVRADGPGLGESRRLTVAR